LLSKAIYVSEQVCIRWCRTGVYYTAKLTFSHPSMGCVLYKCAYYFRIFTVISVTHLCKKLLDFHCHCLKHMCTGFVH